MSEKCFACNKKENLVHIKGIAYCNKHASQIYNHGKILTRTRFDPNEIIICENYAEIILYDKNGNERDKTIIDLEDVDKCKLYKWHKHESKPGKEYVFTRINGTPLRLHRYLLNYYEKELEIDHIDGNGLNNRKYNLRKVTHQQNMMNQRKLPSNNTTGYIGIWYNKKKNKYTAQIKLNKKPIHLGEFDTIEESVKARIEGELKYFGKNKVINFEQGV